MQLPRLPILLLSLFALSLSSCEEDFDPNADYKEIAIIYSLLDASQPVQYVKVNKAFLNTNSNALVIAANNPDSTVFYSPIEVKLEKLKVVAGDTSVQNTYVLSQVTVTDKEEGAFYYPEQVVYASKPNEIPLAGGEAFRVVVTNQETNKTYSASTRVVDPFCVYQVGYNVISPRCQFPAPAQPVEAYFPINVKFNLAPNADMYKASYVISYNEFLVENDDTTLVSEKKTEVTVIANENLRPGGVNALEGNKKVEANSIYTHLKNVINTSQDKPGTFRMFPKVNPIEVKVTGGGAELTKYVEVNNAYSAITQSRPFYSNIKNGAGLFSSRYLRTIPAFFPEKAIDSLMIKHPDLKFRK